jgi:hypothetical protein
MPPRRETVSKKIRVAIEAMVMHGASRDEAANKAGISVHGLYKGLRKAPATALVRALQQVLLTGASARSIARVDKLADGSDSDHVKLKANELLLGMDGLGPVVRSESILHHTGMQAGMTLNVIQAPPPPAIIDQPAPVRMTTINALPRRVPHPSERLK